MKWVYKLDIKWTIDYISYKYIDPIMLYYIILNIILKDEKNWFKDYL